MQPLVFRALVALVVAPIATSCTAPARTDTASLPATSPPATSPATTTTVSLPPSTTVVAPAGPDIIAWLGAEAAAATLAELVAGWQGISRVELVAGDDAVEELAELFSGRPDLVAGVSAQTLPASLRIDLTSFSFVGNVAAQLRSLSDVDEVLTAITPACNPFSDWNVVLFVADDLDLTRLHSQLNAADGLTDITVVGRDEAFAEYLDRFAGLTASASGITVQDMSVSLRAKTSNPVTISLLSGRFEGDASVKGIQVFTPGAPACP